MRRRLFAAETNRKGPPRPVRPYRHGTKRCSAQPVPRAGNPGGTTRTGLQRSSAACSAVNACVWLSGRRNFSDCQGLPDNGHPRRKRTTKRARRLPNAAIAVADWRERRAEVRACLARHAAHLRQRPRDRRQILPFGRADLPIRFAGVRASRTRLQHSVGGRRRRNNRFSPSSHHPPCLRCFPRTVEDTGIDVAVGRVTADTPLWHTLAKGIDEGNLEEHAKNVECC